LSPHERLIVTLPRDLKLLVFDVLKLAIGHAQAVCGIKSDNEHWTPAPQCAQASAVRHHEMAPHCFAMASAIP
jgi:hypothetical protein